MIKDPRKQKRARFKLRVPHTAEWWFTLLFILGDALVINQIFLWVFEFWLGGSGNQGVYLSAYIKVRWWLFAFFVVFGWLFDMFRLRSFRAASDIFSSSAGALLSSFVAFNFVVFFSRSMASLAFTFPRPIILLSTGISIFGVFLFRILVLWIFKPEPIILRAAIVGDEVEGKRILKHFHQRGGIRFRLKGHFSSDKIEELASFVIFHQIQEVIVTDPHIPLEAFWASIFYHRKVEPHPFKVRVAFDPATAIGNIGLKSLEDLPMTTLSSQPLSLAQRLFKRVFDIVFTLFAILVSSPVMILAAILIPRDSPGPIFYKQKRVGRFGKEFEVLKFRSMRMGAEKGSGPQIATHDDPRTTSLGKFLRRFGVDELPQFFLVLIGEMSVVGPRPERPFFVDKHLEFQGRRLAVRPGVTGLAAVNARYYLRLTDKVAYDYYYLDRYSIILDIKIIFQTVWVLLFEQGKGPDDPAGGLDKGDRSPDPSFKENDEEDQTKTDNMDTV